MQIGSIKIYDNVTIPIRYFYFKVTAKNPITSLREYLAEPLYELSKLLKSPLSTAAAWFTKGHHVTPGYYVIFAANPLIDRMIKFCLSALYYSMGITAACLSFFPWIVGNLIQGAAIKLHGQSIHYFESPFVDADNKSSPLDLLTRNLAALPKFISNNANLRPPMERLAELINSFIQPREHTKIDVLCLQKVFGKEHAAYLLHHLKSKFKYFLYDIADRTFGLDSGLFFASNKPIVEAKFIKPPLPVIIHASLRGISTSVESITNKGILYVVIKNGDQYDIVINAHVKSNIGFDHAETVAIEKIRADGLRVLNQGLFHYIDELESRGIIITHVYLGGDLNVSDVQESGEVTYERSGIFAGDRKSPPQDLSFLFDGTFPVDHLDTWSLNPHPPNSKETGYGQANYNVQESMPGVSFDQGGFFVARPESGKRFTVETSIYDDQGHSQHSPASDHFGKKLRVRLVVN